MDPPSIGRIHIAIHTSYFDANDAKRVNHCIDTTVVMLPHIDKVKEIIQYEIVILSLRSHHEVH
jgi:hypothetical protein